MSLRSTGARTLGLYVHLPFCRVRCSYCPFAVSTDLSLHDRYTEALLAEIDARAGDTREVDTIFFGGGTPSRMSIDALQRITTRLRSRFRIAEHAEFSLEANPEDITPESLSAWRDLGVNRLSIGVQSFDDRELLPLGRVHGAARAREAVELAVSSGLRSSLDLILGLPQQSAESFRATLDTAIALGAEHVSLYMLDLEEGTSLFRQVNAGRTEIPEDDLVSNLYLEAIDRFAAAGLAQYEISNFARPGEECRHNIRYWQRLEYHGFGLGAHSFIGSRRFANTREIERYVADAEAGRFAADFSEELGDEETRRETIFLNLRQTRGIDYALLQQLRGEEATEWVTRGLHEGWLQHRGERVAFTGSGFLLSNEYMSQLF
jgi:oxygen-independent coproporphyrinogen-3 oxidase